MPLDSRVPRLLSSRITGFGQVRCKGGHGPFSATRPRHSSTCNSNRRNDSGSFVSGCPGLRRQRVENSRIRRAGCGNRGSWLIVWVKVLKGKREWEDQKIRPDYFRSVKRGFHAFCVNFTQRQSFWIQKLARRRAKFTLAHAMLNSGEALLTSQHGK